MDIEMPTTSYSDILQRLVRRYMFKLERQKEEGCIVIIICNFCTTLSVSLALHVDSHNLSQSKTHRCLLSASRYQSLFSSVSDLYLTRNYCFVAYYSYGLSLLQVKTALQLAQKTLPPGRRLDRMIQMDLVSGIVYRRESIMYSNGLSLRLTSCTAIKNDVDL